MNRLLNEFLSGKYSALLMDLNGIFSAVQIFENALIFPGSFNPIHHGHERMFHVAEQLTGREGYLEISIRNVDKLALQADELLKRLEKLKGRFRVVLTHSPRFIEKAALFTGSVFLMGYDTAKRLVDPAYCEENSLHEMFQEFRKDNCSFLVAGRMDNGTFQTLTNLNIPSEFKDLFIEIGTEHFREDISSTELRKNRE